MVLSERPTRASKGEKPYRTYRAGGGKRGSARERRQAEGKSMKPTPARGRRRGWKKPILLVAAGLTVCLFALTVWGALGYMAVAGGVAAANKRLPASARAALAKPAGSLLSSPTDVLLIGTDHSGGAGRSADDHSDSIMLLRTDPGHHRLVYLSIPRDLLAAIPGYGTDKINTAMQVGGPALAIQTIGAFTRLPVNHIAIVDFTNFLHLVDAVGGITVDVPERILSDKFDCPYNNARCASWPGWRFAKGPQQMNAHQALIYSRIRVNQLNPADSDVTRTFHQQQIMQAVLAKLAGIDTFFSLPFEGGSLLKPLSTDLSTWDFVQLAWIKLRTATTLHCRLGGTPDGNGNLIPSPADTQVLEEVLGKTRPRPPSPSQGIYAPGCVTGNQPLPS
jgi:LCP family protein required for cell wall assembly